MTSKDGTPSDEAALAWFVRLHDEQATQADRAAFEAWRASDGANARAWTELERIWGGLGEIGEAIRLGPPPRPSTMEAHRPTPRQRRPWRRLGAAAVVLLAVAAAWQLAPAGLLADHRTGIGERRIVRLDDGSQVELGPDSALDISFSNNRRQVRLIAGEAFFAVVKDAGRPFTVEAGRGRVEVLGTEFDVRIGDDETVAVAVMHNAVAVNVSGQAVRLDQGQGASYGGAGVSAVGEVDLDAVLAWRRDQIVFHDAPLDAVLATLGRYRRGHVQLIGGDLGQRRITAVFDARQPDAAIETIARSLDLRMLRATSLLIALTAW
jgi:transmembrane sensor